MNTNGSGVIPLTVGGMDYTGDDLRGCYIGDPYQWVTYVPNTVTIRNVFDVDKVRLTLAEFEALRKAAQADATVKSALRKLQGRIEIEVAFP